MFNNIYATQHGHGGTLRPVVRFDCYEAKEYGPVPYLDCTEMEGIFHGFEAFASGTFCTQPEPVGSILDMIRLAGKPA